jgi:hypothetical protein
MLMVSTGLICVSARGTNAPPQVAARTPTRFYVDSRDGNDSNAGKSALALWKSLAKVNSTTFPPGDRILLKSSSVW